MDCEVERCGGILDRRGRVPLLSPAPLQRHRDDHPLSQPQTRHGIPPPITPFPPSSHSVLSACPAIGLGDGWRLCVEGTRRCASAGTRITDTTSSYGSFLCMRTISVAKNNGSLCNDACLRKQFYPFIIWVSMGRRHSVRPDMIDLNSNTAHARGKTSSESARHRCQALPLSN